MIRSAGYLFLRLIRIILGFALLIAGIVLSLPGVPGPGIVVVILALSILSRDFHWAERAHTYVHRKWDELRNRHGKASTPKETEHG